MPIIYRPNGRAQEYSHLAINHYVGCGHGCNYCWAPVCLHIDRTEFVSTPHPKKNVISQLQREVRRFAGTDERVLLSFTSDPYQPLDATEKLTRDVIKILRLNDIPFQVLSKGGMRAARDFNLYGPRDAFAVTLTFLDEGNSRRWEPNAAIPSERIMALKLAKSHGIETWVSLEPVIDADETIQIIKQTHELVDLYKIGVLNYQRSGINWRQFGKKAIEACRDCKTDFFIKHDLAEHLDGFSFTNSDNRKVVRKRA